MKQESVKTRHSCCGTKEISPLLTCSKVPRIAIQTVTLKTEKNGVN